MTINQKTMSNLLCFACGFAIAVVGAYMVSHVLSATDSMPVAENQAAAAFEPTSTGEELAEVSSATKPSAKSEMTASAGSVNPVTLTDDNFVDHVLGSSRPVLVDFWAAWCQPCRVLAPAIDEIAATFGDQAMIGKLNVDENPQVAGALRVEALPTLMIFKDGRVVDQIVGTASPDQISQRLQAVVDAHAS